MGYHLTLICTDVGAKVALNGPEVEAAFRTHPAVARVEARADGFEVTLGTPAEPLVLFWDDGWLWTAQPDEPALEVLIAVAAQLGARVRGDELETYRTVDDTYTHPDDRAQAQRASELSEVLYRRSRRRRRLMLVGLTVVPPVAALLFQYWKSRG